MKKSYFWGRKLGSKGVFHYLGVQSSEHGRQYIRRGMVIAESECGRFYWHGPGAGLQRLTGMIPLCKLCERKLGWGKK